MQAVETLIATGSSFGEQVTITPRSGDPSKDKTTAQLKEEAKLACSDWFKQRDKRVEVGKSMLLMAGRIVDRDRKAADDYRRKGEPVPPAPGQWMNCCTMTSEPVRRAARPLLGTIARVTDRLGTRFPIAGGVSEWFAGRLADRLMEDDQNSRPSGRDALSLAILFCRCAIGAAACFADAPCSACG